MRTRAPLDLLTRGVLLVTGWGLVLACQPPQPASDARMVDQATHYDGVGRLAETAANAEAPAQLQDLRQPLAEDTAVTIALASNRELRATFQEIGIARAEWREARVLPNPVAEVELLPERESQLELRLEYSLTEALLSPVRARAAVPRVEAARLRAARMVVDTARQVRMAYRHLAAELLRLEQVQVLLDVRAAEREAADALATSGNVPEVEASRYVAEHERARAAVAEAEIEVVEAREALVVLLGASGPEADLHLAGGLPEVPATLELAADLEQKVVDASLALAVSTRELAALGRETAQRRAEGLTPDVDVDLHLLWQDPNQRPVAERDQEWRVGGGLSTTLPVFDRGQGRIESAEARYDALLERHVGLAIALRSAVRATSARLASAHARFLHLDGTALVAQRKLSEHLLLQYNAMQVSVFELLEARRLEAELALLAIDAREACLIAQAELDALLAGGTPS